MPKDFELSGPAFVGLFVRDVAVSAEFYERTLGFRRDPEGFRVPGGAGVTILRPLKTGRFGRQFTFVDPDGYAITIYDRDAPPDGWEKEG